MEYRAHSSAVKEKAFIMKELDKQLRTLHVDISPWKGVNHLQGLWLSPLAAIPQAGRKSRLIYNCFGAD